MNREGGRMSGVKERKRTTHHLDLSVIPYAVDLDLLDLWIGQGVVQRLLGGTLQVGCLPYSAPLWRGGDKRVNVRLRVKRLKVDSNWKRTHAHTPRSTVFTSWESLAVSQDICWAVCTSSSTSKYTTRTLQQPIQTHTWPSKRKLSV